MSQEKYKDDTAMFLSQREERFGGKISWKGFSLFYGDNQGNVRERGVFVFRIADSIYFEDFEITPKILGIPVAQKNKSEYVKFEGSFKVGDIACIRNVTRSSAMNYVNGKSPLPKSVSVLGKFFTEVVKCVEFKDGSVKFFEFAGSVFEQALK